MALERSQLVAGVYGLCGDPEDAPLKDGGLPLNVAFEVLYDCEEEMLRELDLSDQNRRVAKMEVTLNGTDFSVPRADFTSASYAFLRTDATEGFIYPVEVVNHSALLQAGYDNKLAVAFYGTPPRGETSWEAEAGHALRVWYERGGNDSPVLSETTEVGGLYDSHLKLQAAAQCRELMNLPVGAVLQSRLARGERQWKSYVGRSRSSGLADKAPVFVPPSRRRYTTEPRRFRLP